MSTFKKGDMVHVADNATFTHPYKGITLTGARGKTLMVLGPDADGDYSLYSTDDMPFGNYCAHGRFLTLVETTCENTSPPTVPTISEDTGPCTHPQIDDVPCGIGPAAFMIKVCTVCKEEIN